MKENKNVPEIRFKEFTEDWGQHKFINSIDKIIDFRGRTPKKLGLNWSENGILALSALNVKDGYIDKSIDAHFGDYSLYKKWMTGNELHKNQVLFTTEAPAGNVAQVPDNSKYILSQRVIAFELDNKKYDETFFATLLRTPTIQNKILNISSGGTAKGVSQRTLSELDINIPANINEQIKLGKSFKELNNLITLHQRKYEKLVNVKKSMLEKMFPKNSSKLPEIRFKGFTENWEQLKLKDLCDVFDGTHQTPNYTDSGVMFLSVENIKDLKSEKYISNSDFKNNFKVYPEKNDILMTRIGDIGTTNIIKDDVLKAYYVSLALLKCRNINPYYLNSAIKSNFVQNGLRLRSLLTAIPMKINKDQIGEVDINYPINPKEQSNIGKMFDKIDSLISLQQCKLEKLNNIKKSMLEKMFV